MKKSYYIFALLFFAFSGDAVAQIADSLKLRRGIVEFRSSVRDTASRVELRMYVPDSAAVARHIYFRAPLYMTTTWGVSLPTSPPSAGQYLKAVSADSLIWDTVTASGGSPDIKEDGSTVATEASSVNFGPGFDVNESPSGQANVTIDRSENPVNLASEVTGELPDGNVSNTVTLDNLTQVTTRNHSRT
jgi:hypothetical protein